MTVARAGTLLALGVTGWPLYQLVTLGDLDLTSALLRVLGVTAACVYGVSLVVRLAQRYETEAEIARQKRLDDLFTEMQEASDDGVLADDTADAGPAAGSEP